MFSKYFSIVTFASLVLLAFNLVVSASGLEEKPLLHPLFADHAVLQRDARVPVWGWTAPGATITVSFAGQKKNAAAGTDGKWKAYLDPMPANKTGRVLKVWSDRGNQRSEISDILVGDVWLCTGQSNMEMGMGVCNVPDKIAGANFPLIRLLMVPKKIAYTPQSTLQCAWLPCSPANLLKGGWGGFSAAGYFFGLELHRNLDVPVGLIETCWGGTVCEAWTSGEALAPLGDFASDIEQVKQVATAPEPDKLGAVMDRWFQAKDPGTQKSWFKPETDVSGWKTANLPANWKACGIPGYEGIVWAQKTVDIPAAWAGRELVFSFGTIGDCDETRINGIALGRVEYFDEPRFYKVPADLVKVGSNVITMRIVNVGNGGFFGPAEQMKVYPSGNESAAISLAGKWRIQETATRASTGAPLIGNSNMASVLFNGMIAPLLPFAIKGAIWYQGESNADRGYQYRTLLPAMIRDWRSRFGVGDFGFHIVSLANYKKMSDAPCESDWAELREAQAMTAKALPNCGIAMTIDIGDAADIHPKNKNEVGRRLALSALAITYGKNTEWSGPWYKTMEINGKGIRLSFDHAQSGLVAKGNKLTGFAIAGADRNFVWADAVIDGTTVQLSSPDVPAPVAVRYGWDSNPACNLYNKENLPAVPFRTDDWPGSTKRTGQQVITETKQKSEPAPEPADPDTYDLSVWEKVKPGIHSGFGSADIAGSKSVPPEVPVNEILKLQGWRGERVNGQLLVWSSGNPETISIDASELKCEKGSIGKKNISVSVVRYILTDAFPGGNDRKDKSKFPVHLKPDLLSEANSFTIEKRETRPVWISVNIPVDAVPGTYKGTISRQSASGTVNHEITLEVLNKTLPAPSEWSFHLDLWQNPYSVARYHGVKLWSNEHFELLKPLLKKLAAAGQKCITATLTDKPWGGDDGDGPCYDAYGSMINWTKRTDGTWNYDYTVFDQYVELAMECGIKGQISCYSMVPISNKFTWFDEKTSQIVVQEAFPGTETYENIWSEFLADFRSHLRVKGWLDLTAIGLDEREEEEMTKLFGFLKKTAPEFKIAMAGFYYKDINPSIYDFSSNWRHTPILAGDVIESRKKSGLKTTYYVACMIPKPNNFTFSPPSESCYEGWYASAMGFDGFLRWASNSWPENPVVDSRYTRWPSGDTFLVYPGALSSIRFERMREGIQDYEKIRILRKELSENASDEAKAELKKLNNFMDSIDFKTLDNRTASEVINDGKRLLHEIVNTVNP